MTVLFEPMYDAVTVRNLPSGGVKYAGYVNGEFANKTAIQARFPKARVFGIDVTGEAYETASIFDWEKFDIQSGAVLVRTVLARNRFRPSTATVYCDRSSLETVETVLKDIWHQIWLSTLDGTDLTGKHTSTGSLIVGTQLRGGVKAAFDTSNTLVSWR